MGMIKKCIDEISTTTPLTVVSHGNHRNTSLRQFLLNHLAKPIGDKDGFLAEPFFECMFPWETSKRSLDDLVKSGLLKPDALRAIRATLPDDVQYLRTHQEKALDAIERGKSIIVTTGTGSGKTECFLYPIMNVLAREFSTAPSGALPGVRALFLYPLNALIESQRKRFSELCSGVAPRVRFALFNGNTPTTGTTQPDEFPEMKYRREIRSTPPNLLVTNSTMLELALVRNEDQTIFQKSQGKLQFVVLDEAHTYMGSDAAELAMRLRRTLLAFGVEPKDVRFIATSATSGEDGGEERLKNFLASIAGIPATDVEVIGGRRTIPELGMATGEVSPSHVLSELQGSSDPVSSYRVLVRCPRAMKLRKTLHTKGRLRLGEIASELALNQQDALHFLDIASDAVPEVGSDRFFLPLKTHLFQRAFHGAWACWNPACSCKDSDLGEDWKYGQVYLEPPHRSPDDQGHIPENWDKCMCGSSLFEVLTCTHCGAPILGACEENLVLSVPGIAQEDLEPDPDVDDDADSVSEDASSGHAARPVLVLFDGAVDTKHWSQTGDRGMAKERIYGFVGPRPRESKQEPIRCPSCSHPIHLKAAMPKKGAFPIGANGNLSSSKTSAKAFFQALCRPVLRCDQIDAAAASLPLQGRRMLGFTDSRQGTAYNAAAQGLHAEISATRVWLFDEILRRKSRYPSVDEQVRHKLTTMAPILGKPVEELLLNKELVTLEMRGLQEPTLTFQDARGLLSNRLRTLVSALGAREEDLARVFHLPQVLGTDVGYESLAELFLWREVSFRTRRKRSLESLGLMKVEYGLDVQVGLGGFFGDHEKTKNFLKLLLDFGFRTQGNLTSFWNEPDLVACYGSRASKGSFMQNANGSPRYDPSSLEPSRWRWIEVLASELLHAYGMPHDWLAVRSLLSESVDWLDQRGYISPDKCLKVERLQFLIPDKIWLCPVTKTLLDVAAGVGAKTFSPYSVSPIHRHPTIIEGDGIQVPKDREGFLNLSERSKDWWTDLHSEVVGTDPSDAYMVAQEHSAQLNKDDLKRHQEAFAAGRINQLNCSTTMEMGVDIGAISLVALTNVPPYPHNYLQRAGRAGRGGQGQSLVWTIAGSGSHDNLAWHDPLKWVEGTSHRPHVSLDSSRIVQRHVNSWLLSEWMKENGSGIKYPRQWFLGYTNSDGICLKIPSNGIPGDSPEVGIFNSLWELLEKPDAESVPAFDLQDVRKTIDAALVRSLSEEFFHWLEAGVHRIPASLVVGTPLQEMSDRKILKDACTYFRLARERWAEDIVRLLEVVPNIPNPSGRWRLLLELKRLSDNPLPVFLAEKGALPMNSLPSEVVQLSLPTKRHGGGSDGLTSTGVKKKYANMPSRERPIAIREYAPGCGVILDGKVHTIRYVVRNWKQPGFPDPQTLREVALCHVCGAARVSAAQMGGDIAACPECGALLTGHIRRKMLVPSGFVADSRVTRSVDEVQRSSYEIPRIGMHHGSRLLFLPQGELRYGRATVVHLNGGGWEAPRDTTNSVAPAQLQFGPAVMAQSVAPENPDDGFHVCMECGYTVQATGEGTAGKNPLADHKRWDKDIKALMPCEGASKSVGDPGHQVVSLGALQETDATTIRLEMLKGNAARKAAYTWALALRNALAKALGIRPEELGWSARPGREGWGIVLFDKAPGGADFSPKAVQNLSALFRSARRSLDCTCETACHRCLLTRETQHHWDDLDRKAALEAVPEEFLTRIGLPQSLMLWGDDSRGLMDSLGVEVMKMIQGERGELRLYLQGPPETWDVENWNEADVLREWARKEGHRLRLVVARSQWDKASSQIALSTELMSVVGVDGHLDVVLELPIIFRGAEVGFPMLAEFVQDTGATQIVAVSKSGQPVVTDPIGSSWGGANGNAMLVSGPATPTNIMATCHGVKSLFPSNAAIYEVPAGECWHVTRFAKNLLSSQQQSALVPLFENMLEAPTKLVYSDIYLRSPLNFRLLYEIVKFFDPKIVVVRNGNRVPDRFGGGWLSDYHDPTHSDTVLHNILADTGRSVTVEHPMLPHERILLLEYPSGRTLRFDIGKGLGYWRFQNRIFPGGGRPNNGAGPIQDARLISAADFRIETSEVANLYARFLP
jgi:hypothetical protein